MTASAPQAPPRASRLAGYLLALAAGATWGTTGPLSTGLYALMPATSIGFWRVLLGTACLALWGLAFRRELFRVDRTGWLLVGLGGGALVALFEVAYQFAIAGAGVAGAAAMLYTAPAVARRLARSRRPHGRIGARGQPVLLLRGEAHRSGARGSRRHDRAGGGHRARVALVPPAPVPPGLARADDGGRRGGRRVPPGSQAHLPPALRRCRCSDSSSRPSRCSRSPSPLRPDKLCRPK